MDTSDSIYYTECYKTLEIKQQYSWEEIRAAYKKLAQYWHPDRHINTQKHTEAEKKFREINQAFRLLEEYVKSKGFPPAYSRDPEEAIIFDNLENYQREKSQSEHRQANEWDSTPIENVRKAEKLYKAVQRERKTHARSELIRKIYTYICFVIFLLTCSFIYTNWISPKKKDIHKENTETAMHDSNSSPLMTVTQGMSRAVAKEVSKLTQKSPELPRHEPIVTPKLEDSLTFKESKPPALSINRPSAFKRPKPAGKFGYGDSMSHVISVHGPPTEMKGNVWHYEQSIIYFENGKVKDWRSHTSFPLSTMLKF